MYAVINTVDSYDPEHGQAFPERGVYLFDNDLDAEAWAASVANHHCDFECQMSDADTIECFQDTLTPTEYFHVVRVVDMRAAKQGATV